MSDEASFDCQSVIPPSSLFVFWPGEEPPLAEEIRLRVADWGQAIESFAGDGPEDTLWSFWFELIDRPATYLLWCEPVTTSHLALLRQVRWRDEAQERIARSCRWMVGIEGAISLRDPTADYQFQLRLGDALGRDWSPAIYDANAFRFLTMQDVRHLAGSKTPPRRRALYGVHKVRSTAAGLAPPAYWIHTHGLERAAIPDLELFHVPESLLPAALELIEAVADLWLEFCTPEPTAPFLVGDGLEVSWRPWQAVAAELAPNVVGGWAMRQPELGHTGYRAVLIEADPQGRVGPARPPLELLRRLTGSESTLFKTLSETRRLAQLARERWASFGMLFSASHPPDWRFRVKLSFLINDTLRLGEHLWFDAVELRPGRICARLVSRPKFVPDLCYGDVGWYELDRLSDWRIVTPAGDFDPETADVLLEEPQTV
jgi:hypothetical protein